MAQRMVANIISVAGALRGPNGTRKRENFDDASKVLAAHGRVRVVQRGKRRTIKLNPVLLDGTTEAMSDADAPDIDASSRPAAWNG